MIVLRLRMMLKFLQFVINADNFSVMLDWLLLLDKQVDVIYDLILLLIIFDYLWVLFVELIHDFHFSSQSRIKSIFDVVISSAWQKFSNFRPFISVLLVCLDYSSVFLVGPFIFLDVRIQMVVPPFPALLANSPWECLSDVTPVLGPELLHILREHIILSLSPRTFHHRRVKHFLPTVQALHICPLIQIGSYLLPIFCAKLSD